MSDVLARICAKHFVAGIVLRGAVVIEAAPIVRYMLGWHARRVASYCRSKGWEINRT